MGKEVGFDRAIVGQICPHNSKSQDVASHLAGHCRDSSAEWRTALRRAPVRTGTGPTPASLKPRMSLNTACRSAGQGPRYVAKAVPHSCSMRLLPSNVVEDTRSIGTAVMPRFRQTPRATSLTRTPDGVAKTAASRSTWCCSTRLSEKAGWQAQSCHPWVRRAQSANRRLGTALYVAKTAWGGVTAVAPGVNPRMPLIECTTWCQCRVPLRHGASAASPPRQTAHTNMIRDTTRRQSAT